MTALLELSRTDARRIAIRAQRLGSERPDDLLELVRHLTFLQLDPTAAVAPSADLIAWSRMGAAYDPADLRQALDDRHLFEHHVQDEPTSPRLATVRPMSDLGLYLAQMRAAPTYEYTRSWLEANERFRRDLLARLRDAGPLRSRDIADTSQVPWRSTGWTGNRNVSQMLELLLTRGEVAVAGRAGKQRTFDLAERVYPPDVAEVPAVEADRIRDERRLRSLGIARAQTVGDAGVPARVDGSKRDWRVDPTALDAPFSGRTALLSPFDRLIHDRVRSLEIFEFEYLLEMYKPAAARRWGYFALPVLHEDRLVGKLDATADRKAGVLTINTFHPDVRPTKKMITAINREIASLASWLDLEPGRIS